MIENLEATYHGRDDQGRRTYHVNEIGRPMSCGATVVAINEDEWEYSCDRCSTPDCDHVQVVCADRASFEHADASIG